MLLSCEIIFTKFTKERCFVLVGPRPAARLGHLCSEQGLVMDGVFLWF